MKKPVRPRFSLRFVARGRGPVAVDCSQAMHDIDAEHLGELARRVTFVIRDFHGPAWPEGLSVFDAVVTMQAVPPRAVSRGETSTLNHEGGMRLAALARRGDVADDRERGPGCP